MLKPIEEVDYLIKMHDRWNKRRVFHVYRLKQFHSPSVVNSNFLVDDTGQTSVESELVEEEIPSWNTQHNDNPKTGEQLSELQQSNLWKLLNEFFDVLQDKPGKTSTVEHTIDTGTANPVYLLPYRVPHAYRDMVESELKDTLENGIIEPSASLWSAPMVLVQKKAVF